MNTWLTLKEWSQFGGALALEVGILFFAAKLIALRLRSAQWRRALWQTVVIAMFIVVIGELNGVRGFLRPQNEPDVSAPPQRAVVVTFKDAEMPAPLPLDLISPDQFVTPTQPATISRWQRRASWPALAWLAGTLLVAGRVLLAQFIALVFRLRCRRIDDADLRARAERIRNTLGIRRLVSLIENKRAIAPFTFGTLRPVIVLPRRFMETFTLEQQDVALLHEMAHIAGFDSAWRSVSDLTVAVFWWHPLVWLARRELAHASELAADESSLLLHDGPGRLAECLVACAKELRRPALTTWLGMDGGGFRSALGQRVTRLLQLKPGCKIARGVPWYLRVIAPALGALVLWAGIAVALKPLNPNTPNWRSSILGTALAAAEIKPTAVPETPKGNALEGVREDKSLFELNRLGNKLGGTLDSETAKAYLDVIRSEAAKRVQEGKISYETGRNEAARSNLQAALQLDPKNEAALYYLSLVQYREASIAARKLAIDSTADTNAARAPRVDPQRQAIHKKLRQILLAEWGPIDNRPLTEVIRDLNDAIIRQDSGGKGISFFISPNADPVGRGSGAGPALDPAGLPIPAAGGGTPDLNGVNIRLGTKLKHLDIEEVLNILMIIAETKIKYSVEDFGILISAKGNEPTPLHTRFFRLDPKAFLQALKSVETGTFYETHRRGGGRGERRTNDNPGIQFNTDPPPTNLVPVLKSFFQAAGVDLNAPGRSLFYSDRKSDVMVRATLQELDTVEKALQLLSMNPPQLTIRVKVMEVERDGKGTLGDLYLGSVGAVTNAAPGPSRQGNDLIGDGPRRAPPSEPRLAKSLTVEQLRAAKPEQATTTGILTDEQFRAVIKGLEQRGGTDLLSAPSITTVSGRQAQIKVVDIKYIVTDLDINGQDPKKKEAAAERRKEFEKSLDPHNTNNPTVEPQWTDNGRTIQPIAEPFELGPVVDIVPYVQADGWTIQMTVIPSLQEFIGYDDPGDFVASVGGKTNRVTSPTPLPKFRLRKVATSATVWDGQTLVIGAGSARHLEQKRNPDGTTTNTFVEKELFFFITPQLIDAAGNAMHSKEEQPFTRKNAPPR